MAVVQPTLDVASQNVDLFVIWQIDGWGLIVAMLLFALVPPMAMLALEALAAWVGDHMRSGVHLAFVWGLSSLVALSALTRLFPSQRLTLFCAAGLAGLAATLAYVRADLVRAFLTALSPAPVLFLAYFFLFTPVNTLVPGSEDASVDVEVTRNAPVVMLLLDELPLSSLLNSRGRVEAKLVPNFAEFARSSTWYPNTAAAADETEQAVPAVLTGGRPRHGALPVLSDHPSTLFTMLGRTHHIEAMEHITWLCPRSLCESRISEVRRMTGFLSAMSLIYAYRQFGAPETRGQLHVAGFTIKEALRARDPNNEIDPANAAPGTLARYPDTEFESFIASIRPAPVRRRPPLYFLHTSLPHAPWQYLPGGRVYTNFQNPPGLSGDGQTWTRDSVLVAHGLQRHLLQVKFADRLLGRLLRRLRSTGLFDRSLIVVAADHGGAFIPGGSRRPVTAANAGEVGVVPFMVKVPGQHRGRIDGTQIQTTKILPIIARLLGAKAIGRVSPSPATRSGAGATHARIVRHRGGAEVVGWAKLRGQRDAAVHRKEQLFGGEAGEDGLYGVGPDRALLGASIAELDSASERHGSLELNVARDLGRVQATRFVPALISGSVPADVRRVIVAVNGRVRGTAPTSLSGGGASFSTVVPERSFQAGSNKVEVFSVSGRKAGRRVTLLGPAR